jgi:type II secretion system protein I
MRRERSRDEGFTLIEVMVALGVFALVSLATVSILITALRTVRENEDRVLAANIARSELEQARISGAEAVPLGLSERRISEFTVRTSANWVGVDQQVSACDAISPGRDFLRVSVEVSGRSLAAPQQIDGVIPGVDPQDASGAMTVFVGDAYADPLSDVTITGTDPFHIGNNFRVVTGPDGCVFLPDLEPSGSLQVSVQRQIGGVSLIARTPEADRQQVQINLDEVSRVSFELALPAGVRFESPDAPYPVPDGIEVSWKQLTTGSITRVTPLATDSLASQLPAANAMPTGPPAAPTTAAVPPPNTRPAHFRCFGSCSPA